ncbi:MAG: hypothetical protein KDD45_03050 [Bdellovibrionales bacterium]|nr:hypothetical protein [Bdellovibrionales bacterium]
MKTILDFRSFDNRYQSGLLFSIFEGLLPDQKIKVIFDQDPGAFHEKFEEVNFLKSEWKVKKISDSLWEVCITKNSKAEKHQCCGVCGGE